MASDESFGWDLLYKTIGPQINNNTDILIALAHFVLIKSKFRCIGVGEDKTFSEDEESSELLPPGWNDSPEKYALRYVADMKLYLLLASPSEHVFILNLLDVGTKRVSNVALYPGDLVKTLNGPLKKMIPTASSVMDRIRNELIEPVFAGTTATVTTQTTTIPRRDNDFDPLRVVTTDRPFGLPGRGSFGGPSSAFPPGGLGSGDLDPLGQGRPGNMGVIPRNGPPRGGARFDPFGPGPGARRGPNNDEFQPPGFGDYYS